MTAATAHNARRRRGTAALIATAICAALALAGCGTSHPEPILADELAEAQTFPYYRVYWVGPSFDGNTLAAADGLKGYLPTIGDSVYYGDCVQSKGIFGGGTCQLPLQVTTVVYVLHLNAALGKQRNILVRGVPATVYDEGQAIEIYTGRVAIDVFSDTFAHALQASEQLYPINAPGSSSGPLPPPVFCPGLSGPIGSSVARVLAALPRHICQQTAAQQAYTKRITAR
ncbi:MAG TPA: hypothetical protein VK790_10075 [Solirubrobacteraceae bacterium]|nr:hypothetical protein [Solirubrobacteraceae bacterium]